jgi:hypothetical protein
MENIEILIKHYLWNRVKYPNDYIIWESDRTVSSYISHRVSTYTKLNITEDIKESVWEPVRNIIEDK